MAEQSQRFWDTFWDTLTHRNEAPAEDFYERLKQTNIGKLAKGAVDSTVSGATLPGDVYAGRVDPLSDRGVERTLDLAGMAATGGFSRAALASPGSDVELGVFGGRGAQTADVGALDQAWNMSMDGADPNYIRKMTGWFEPDSQVGFRHEISDQGARTWKSIADPDTTGAGSEFLGPLGDYLDHPALFAAYPDMANIELSVINGPHPKGYGGYYNSIDPITGKERIVIHNADTESDKGLTSIILHEAQHGIANREGFSRGTNPTAAGGYEGYLRDPGEIEARDVQDRMDLDEKQRWGLNPAGVGEQMLRSNEYYLDDMENRLKNMWMDSHERNIFGTLTGPAPYGRDYYGNPKKAPAGDAPGVTPSANADAPVPASAVARDKELWEQMFRTGEAL